MKQISVGVRELKGQLSRYLRQVKTGATVVITERGTPIGRLVPAPSSLEERLEEPSCLNPRGTDFRQADDRRSYRLRGSEQLRDLR